MSQSLTETALQQAESRLRALMLQGLAGNAAAQEQMLLQLSVLLRRFYQRRLHRDHAEVEDLVQETLIAVHTRRATYDMGQAFTAWAYAIARYKLIDYLRKQKVREVLAHELPDAERHELFSVEPTTTDDASRDVDTLLTALPAQQRHAIELTQLQGLSIEEAALQSGQSESSIKVGVHRGIKKLARLFASH